MKITRRLTDLKKGTYITHTDGLIVLTSNYDSYHDWYEYIDTDIDDDGNVWEYFDRSIPSDSSVLVIFSDEGTEEVEDDIITSVTANKYGF